MYSVIKYNTCMHIGYLHLKAFVSIFYKCKIPYTIGPSMYNEQCSLGLFQSYKLCCLSHIAFYCSTEHNMSLTCLSGHSAPRYSSLFLSLKRNDARAPDNVIKLVSSSLRALSFVAPHSSSMR